MKHDIRKSPSMGRSRVQSTAPAGTLKHLLQNIDRILSTPEASFINLALVAGLNPKLDFKNIRLNGLPLADEDIAGFDFSGSDLRSTGVERSKRSGAVFTGAIFDGPSLDPQVIAFNKSLRSLPYREAEAQLDSRIFHNLRGFDVISFGTLMKKSQRFKDAERWHGEMLKAGVAPNDVTFNTLISKALTLQDAERWHGEMLKAGVAPDDVTANILIVKAFQNTEELDSEKLFLKQ